MNSKVAKFIGGAVALVVIGLSILVYFYYRYTKEGGFNTQGKGAVRLYIYPNLSWDNVIDSIKGKSNAPLINDLKWHLKYRAKGRPKVGSYTIEPNMSVQALYNRLVYGMQTPVGLHFNSYRLPSQIYRRISQQLLVDSIAVAHAMNDTTLLHQLGVADTTLVYYLVPNTYEVYWDITPEKLVARLAKESQAFWDTARVAKAKRLNLSPYEVINLAAIVEEESAKVDEYPMIAGLYLNRLKLNMPLQADPTIKFALQDFGLRRIFRTHLKVQSPYNTYLNKGLPLGPIRIPSREAIDGVLDAVDHPYIYMCAKDDFSGYHSFAKSYKEHQANAQRYAQALNRRGIF